MDPCVDSSEAVQHGWMELWYQPKIDAHAVATVGSGGFTTRSPSKPGDSASKIFRRDSW